MYRGVVMYYDRTGRPISFEEWLRTAEDKRVALNALPNGLRISTVWLGLDHRFGLGPPLIFETMVFDPKRQGNHDLDCARYSTEEEAIQGHKEMCNKWKDYEPDGIDQEDYEKEG